MLLGITDNLRPKPVFENYLKWIRRVDPSVEFVKLSHHLQNLGRINDMDGLILTGGGDVHPGLYGRGDAMDMVEEVNERRDAFEFEVIEAALERDLPILGICRGLQVMNVCLGGTLILDLQSAGYKDHVERETFENRHDLEIVAGSLLEVITGAGPKRVNSVHHQAADQLGKGLMVSSRSKDGVIESLEWVLKDRMPFLLLVQWHPERMEDFDNPCSGVIADHFLREVRHSINSRKTGTTEKETEHSHG